MVSPFADVEASADYADSLLRGELVRLRPVTEDDLTWLDRWWAHPQWAVLQQSSVRPGPAGAAAEMFRSWSGNTTPGSVGLSIETLADSTFVGHATLYGGSLPARAATLAILVGPGYVGRGYGSDAVRTLLRYGFLEMGLNRVELRVWAFNTRGIRAYARAGFVEEGRRREAVFHDGAFDDEVLMSVLAREWLAVQAAAAPD